jgi:hypothetical protein
VGVVLGLSTTLIPSDLQHRLLIGFFHDQLLPVLGILSIELRINVTLLARPARPGTRTFAKCPGAKTPKTTPTPRKVRTKRAVARNINRVFFPIQGRGTNRLAPSSVASVSDALRPRCRRGQNLWGRRSTAVASTFVRLRPDALARGPLKGSLAGSSIVAAALNPPAPAKRPLLPTGKASTQLLRQNTDDRSAWRSRAQRGVLRPSVWIFAKFPRERHKLLPTASAAVSAAYSRIVEPIHNYHASGLGVALDWAGLTVLAVPDVRGRRCAHVADSLNPFSRVGPLVYLHSVSNSTE